MAETQAKVRLREYETVFLLRPELTDDVVDKVKDRVRGIVNRDGKLLRFTIWGKKKTMYLIAKQPRAIYVHASYLGSPKLVAEVERNLRNFDEVTRYLSSRIADDIDPETRPVQEDVKMAGDVEEAKPGAPEREGGVFLRPEPEEAPAAEEPEEAAEEP